MLDAATSSDASCTTKKVLVLSEIVKVEHLTKYFPVQKSFLEQLFTRELSYVKAVDDVTFSIKSGEFFTLAGESGCGKTTTGRVIVKLLEPTSGKIYFNGADITKLKGEKLRLLRRKCKSSSKILMHHSTHE